MGEAYNRSMCLVNIESNERHNLNDDEYIIGRGWFNVSISFFFSFINLCKYLFISITVNLLFFCF